MADFLNALAIGLTNTFSWPGILIPILGTFLAMVVAFLPGIGGTSVMAILLVLTASWEPVSVLLLFGAIIGGATFMGSVTAILFNIPGSAPNAATLLDGYPLSQKGFPRTAISCAAAASAIGSLFGVIILIALIPLIRPLISGVGSLENLLLGVWGLITIISVPSNSKTKALMMCMLGLMLAMVGSDPVTAQPRWNFGSDELVRGIDTIPVLLGFFTLAEIISWGNKNIRLGEGTLPADETDSVALGIRSVLQHKWLTLRSSIIGTLVGIVPGIGGTVAGFVAYSHAAQSSDDNDEFGKGDIRGLIAPEAAIDAKDGGSLLPAIAFGLPGSEAGVFLVTVLLMHGLVPGTAMLTTQLPLTFTLIIALLFSNLITSFVGVLLTPQLAKLRNFPLYKIALPLMVLCLILVVQINGLLYDIVTLIVFGIIGYIFKMYDWPRVPLLVAFILGNFLERNLAVSTRLFELGRIDPVTRPGAIVILLLIVASIFYLYRRGTRDNGRSESEKVENPHLKADFKIALSIFLFSVLFIVFAIFDSYSGISLLTASVALLLSTSITAKYFFSLSSVNSNHSPTEAIGSASPILFLLASVPLTIFMLGFTLAMAALVFAWLYFVPSPSSNKPATALVWAVLTGFTSYFLLFQVWNVILPTSFIGQFG